MADAGRGTPQVSYKAESQYQMHLASATHRKAVVKADEDRQRALRGGAAAEAAMVRPLPPSPYGLPCCPLAAAAGQQDRGLLTTRCVCVCALGAGGGGLAEPDGAGGGADCRTRSADG